MKTINELKRNADALRHYVIPDEEDCCDVVHDLAILVFELTQIIEEQQQQITDLVWKGTAKYE